MPPPGPPQADSPSRRQRNILLVPPLLPPTPRLPYIQRMKYGKVGEEEEEEDGGLEREGRRETQMGGTQTDKDEFVPSAAAAAEPVIFLLFLGNMVDGTFCLEIEEKTERSPLFSFFDRY